MKKHLIQFTATTIVGQIQSNIVNLDMFLPEEFFYFSGHYYVNVIHFRENMSEFHVLWTIEFMINKA